MSELEKQISDFLSGETSVLNPDDAPMLAEALMENVINPYFEEKRC